MWRIHGVHESYSVHATNNGGRAAGKKPVEEQNPTRESGVQDRVTISPEASFRAKLETVSKQYASSAGSETISAQRMEQLKAQYQGDSCPVSGRDVAQAMLGRVCGANNWGSGQ